MESKMTKDEKYQQHIDSMFGTRDMYSFSAEEAEKVFSNLLECLPNGGKLYKYRKISDKQSFDRVYGSLSEGTLWSSRADQFVDKTDCTVYYDPEEEEKSIEKLLRGNPELIIGGLMRSISIGAKKTNPNFDKTILLRLVDCFDKDSGNFDKIKAVNIFNDYGCDIRECIMIIDVLQKKIKSKIIKDEGVIKLISNTFSSFNQTIRSKVYIFSLCEDYKVKTMWENYAGNNGICIEYDFYKIEQMSCDMKKFFCCTYKVKYVNDYEQVTLTPLIEEYLKCKSEKSTNTELNKKILISQITKTTDYAYEKEWRTFHYTLNNNDCGYAIKADLISGIIFDEHALETENGKKIMTLAKEKGWNIKVRYLNSTSTKYIYEELKSEA